MRSIFSLEGRKRMKYTLRSLNLLKFCAGRSSIGGKDGARTRGNIVKRLTRSSKSSHAKWFTLFQCVRYLSKCISSREANFGQDIYQSLQRSPQDPDTRDGYDLYSAQASFAWPRVNLSAFLDYILSSSLLKSAGFVSLTRKA